MTSRCRDPALDYLQFYDLEGYLFSTVSPRFHHHGRLSAFDFFAIVIWKANRAKSKIAARLLQQGHDDLEQAVRALTSDLHEAADAEARFRLLLDEWGLLIPMASAILTVLYPDEFTVYDVRACDVLGDFHRLANWTRTDRVWDGYQKFLRAIRDAAPSNLGLRDKDRYLWAQAVADQLTHDITRGFGV